MTKCSLGHIHVRLPRHFPIRLSSARAHILAILALTIVAWTMAACSPPPIREYDVPIQDAKTVRIEIQRACGLATSANVPLLIEFSAAWCSDCRKLHRMKQAPALQKEIDHWPRVVVNVGQFDRHRDLLALFGVENIAHWQILRPTNCEASLGTWPRVASRKLEPDSGAERNTSPDDLATWLKALRIPKPILAN